MAETLRHRYVLGVRVDATSYEDATERILGWASRGEGRYVCITSVHGVISSNQDSSFASIQNEADLATPDGMPLVWALRRLGIPRASRVYGPTLTLHICKEAADHGVPIGLFGGTPESLDDFAAFLARTFPGLNIACRIAPPFRPISTEEDEAYTRHIVDSGVRILLVGLGCPKQERWMASHKNHVPAVMVGVGAAFDFHSGRVRQAPVWMQRSGLEWFFRLLMEPKRLWGRYSTIVPRFILLFAMQLSRARLRRFTVARVAQRT